jgi:hypothetical protein
VVIVDGQRIDATVDDDKELSNWAGYLATKAYQVVHKEPMTFAMARIAFDNGPKNATRTSQFMHRIIERVKWEGKNGVSSNLGECSE